MFDLIPGQLPHQAWFFQITSTLFIGLTVFPCEPWLQLPDHSGRLYERCLWRTPVKLDEEEEVMIGIDVKPYRITAVELGWGSDALLGLVQEKHAKYIHYLNISGTGNTEGENKARPKSDVKGMRNQRVHRQLSMVANDPRWDEVTFRCPPEEPKPGKAPELMPAATQ